MTRGALVQMFSEFFPILAFFVAGQLYPFTTAVSILVSTTLLSLVLSLWYLRHWPVMPIVSGIIVIVTGGITVLYDQPDAIIFADTLYFFLLALFIALGFTQQRHFLERVFDATFAMTREGWHKLSVRWLVLLVVAGIANEIVRILMTPEFWVDYKFTKVLLISAFAAFQFRLARRYRLPGESNRFGLRVHEPPTPPAAGLSIRIQEREYRIERRGD